MGDYSDMRDIDRFLRCDSGKKRLGDIRASLIGKTVAEVEFSNDVDSVLTVITFSSGGILEFFMPELTLESLRETFSAEIQEEYYCDYPERRPNTPKGEEKDETKQS